MLQQKDPRQVWTGLQARPGQASGFALPLQEEERADGAF